MNNQLTQTTRFHPDIHTANSPAINNADNHTNININSNTAFKPNIHNLLNDSAPTTSDGHSPISLPLSTSPQQQPSSNGNSTVKSLSPPVMEQPNDSNNTASTETMVDNYDPSSTFKSKSKKKSNRKNSNDEKILLSTSSPEGIAAASQITPNRIANILIKEGPLPIRHLTGHLVKQVPAFGNLSLSKQRRLIMAALESGDLITGCIFEKIGWGQWEAKIVGKDLVKIKIENSLNNNSYPQGNNNSSNNTPEIKIDSAHSKSISPISASPSTSIASNITVKPRSKSSSIPSVKKSSTNNRRESITNQSNDTTIKMPSSPTLGPIQNLRNSLKNYADIDEAIESSSDDDDDIDDDEFDYDSADSPPFANMNNLDALTSNSAYVTTTNTTPNSSNKLQQYKKIPSMRSPSVSSSSRRPSFAGILKPRKPRSSFNQHTLEVALDEAPLERRESRVSFSNSANLSRQSFLRTNISPRMSNNNSSISFNENAIADDSDEDAAFTDEEDWQAIGPSSLRKNRHSSILTPPNPNLLDSNTTLQSNSNDSTTATTTGDSKTDEEMAAIALMDLKTV